MSKRTVLSLYTGDDWARSKPTLGPGLQSAYDVWHVLLKRRGVGLTRASAAWYRQGYFTKHWRHNLDGSWTKVTAKLRPTIVYDKTRAYDSKTNALLRDVFAARHDMMNYSEVVNNPYLTDLLNNKLYQAVIFKKGMPQTTFWPPLSTLTNSRRQTIVLKDLHGSGGKYVYISQQRKIAVKKASVQQAFVAGTVNGRLQDIRIAFVGDKPIYAYSRVAKTGSLYTNVHRGAHMEWLKLSDLKSLLKLSAELARPLEIFKKRFYSLDYIIDPKAKKPYLIEANNMPGSANFPDEVLEHFFGTLTDLLFSHG